MLELLVLKTASGRQILLMRAKSSRFTFRSSTIASITKSAWAALPSTSEVIVRFCLTCPASSFVIRPFSTRPARYPSAHVSALSSAGAKLSQSSTRYPLARPFNTVFMAICLPMAPAPITTTVFNSSNFTFPPPYFRKSSQSPRPWTARRRYTAWPAPVSLRCVSGYLKASRSVWHLCSLTDVPARWLLH